jgi:hypothetical protein
MPLAKTLPFMIWVGLTSIWIVATLFFVLSHLDHIHTGTARYLRVQGKPMRRAVFGPGG